MRKSSAAPAALFVGALFLAACAPHKGVDTRLVGDADQPPSHDVPEVADAAEPSLSDLYPSLGDEDVTPPPSEIDDEQQAEEKFLSAVPNGAMPQLDPKKLQEEFDIPVEVTPMVEQFIEYFQTAGRRWYAIWLSRSGRYLPMMRQVFHENGVPEDMAYLAMIESGFSTKAYSRARASGPWQFIRETGGQYGLNDDWWVDERRDPEQATRAAAEHLKDLYEDLGDWYLAAAAYNAGEGKIDNAIARYHTRNFWELCAGGRYLRKETKQYVPKLLAAAIIAKHPAQFGFGDVEYLEPLEYETVTVPDATDLKVISDCAGADIDSVLELNPSLKRFCTPPGEENFEVRVPKGTAEAFADGYAQIDPSKRVTFRKHTVQSGDTLSKIARLYGTDQDGILRMNHLASAKKMRVGSDLVIPIPSGVHTTVLASEVPQPRGSGNDPKGVVARVGLTRDMPPQQHLDKPEKIEVTSTPPAGRARTNVTLAAGDTLWAISQRYGVSVEDIKHWNGIRNHRSLQAGQSIVVYLPKGQTPAITLASAQTTATSVSAAVATQVGSVMTYKVRQGDTVWDIARAHNVDPGSLMKDNNLSRHSKIKPGDLLEIRLMAGTPAGGN